MPQLRQGLVKGVFLTKASPPWAAISPCACPIKDLDTWYEAVFAQISLANLPGLVLGLGVVVACFVWFCSLLFFVSCLFFVSGEI